MAWLKNVPLFAAIFLFYNGVVLIGDTSTLAAEMLRVQLISGVEWPFTVADLLLTLALIALYVEVLKATRSSFQSVLDHSLSMLVFVAFLVEFFAYEKAGGSVFFLMTLMSFIDVLAGFTVSISAARKDIGLEGG